MRFNSIIKGDPNGFARLVEPSSFRRFLREGREVEGLYESPPRDDGGHGRCGRSVELIVKALLPRQ
jgi:hypothetical protein